MPHELIDNPLPDQEILARIGRVAVEWSLVEWLLEAVLAKISGVDHGLITPISRASSISVVIRIIREFAESPHAIMESRHRLSSLLNRVESLRATRNIVIHGLWIVENGAINVQTVKKALPRDTPFSLQDIENLINQIVGLQGDLVEAAGLL